MSDPRHDFESWLGDEMRRPVRVDPSMRARIMGRIRAEARARVVRPSPRLASPAARDARGNRRGSLAGQTGAVLAAGIAGILALGTLDGLAGAGAGSAARPVAAEAIRDTLRLVRFVLSAPAAKSVALVGDFNGWRRDATLLAAGERGEWTAAVALVPGLHRYAFVVDDTQWVADPASTAVAGDSERSTSVLFVEASR